MQSMDNSTMPDPDLHTLYEGFEVQIKLLSQQHEELCHKRESLTMKITEIERVVESLSAAVNTAAQYFPQPAEPAPPRGVGYIGDPR